MLLLLLRLLKRHRGLEVAIFPLVLHPCQVVQDGGGMFSYKGNILISILQMNATPVFDFMVV